MAKENTKSLKDFPDVTNEVLLEFYDCCISKLEIDVTPNLRKIFNIALKDRSLFPKIKSIKTYEDYVSSWINKYITGSKNLPSNRIANPKNTCSDPAIKLLVKQITGVSDYDANEQELHHNLFMSAENIQGSLIEEYISNKLYGTNWFWCIGQILSAIDFCTLDGKCLLQIKNKNNTENSSSDKIRNGTTIKKWYRLGTKTKNKVKEPSFKWDKLNEIINNENITFSEEDYNNFLIKVTKLNKDLITNK